MTKFSKQDFIKSHKLKLQSFAFIGILALPFLLYLAAQSQSEVAVTLLLGLMTLLMLAIIVVS